MTLINHRIIYLALRSHHDFTIGMLNRSQQLVPEFRRLFHFKHTTAIGTGKENKILIKTWNLHGIYHTSITNETLQFIRIQNTHEMANHSVWL